MLDKTAYKILEIIVSMTGDEVNLAVNKSDILSLLGEELSPEEFDKIMEALAVNDMVTVLYNDVDYICVAVRPKGKLIAEKNKRAEEQALAAAEAERKIAAEKENTTENTAVAPHHQSPTVVDVRRFAVICAVSSFLGGFVAAMITFLVTLFI